GAVAVSSLRSASALATGGVVLARPFQRGAHTRLERRFELLGSARAPASSGTELAAGLSVMG
ncbi:MAG TPA: hypothetical protein VFQ35_01745, partial [Polyangiaceae bacterium]|nr:hypothetical protein [Polyangiaceae bacterium]